MFGLGVDVVHVPRIASLLARRGPERLAKRILSQKERPFWNGNSASSLRYLAVRFSVKEAAYKALYPQSRPTWKELTYFSFGCQTPGSKPVLLYEPIVPRKSNKLGRLLVSVSHDGEYIVSTVIVHTP